jgi:hypothetical protein
MKSNEECPPLDLDRAFPTSPEDCAALRRRPLAGPTSFEDYLRFLANFQVPQDVLRARRGPRGEERFTL